MRFIVLILTLMISGTGGAWAPGALANAGAEWKIVPNQEVCMVTEAHFARPQIPVPVNGKTYYGCCENCKKTLGESAEARTAKDALTGKSIDKATATIAANTAGHVLYFANKKNFEKFVKAKTPAK